MLGFVKKIKKVGNFLKGLGMIFIGLKLMSSSCNDESIKIDTYACTLCKSQVEILSINTIKSIITFKCLNNEKNHGIIKIDN